MSKIKTQGVHHITFVGSNREAIIDFYQGVLGMPLVFEQPNWMCRMKCIFTSIPVMDG